MTHRETHFGLTCDGTHIMRTFAFSQLVWVVGIPRVIRAFAIVRVKKEATSWEFPLSFDELRGSPLAGPFDARTAAALDHALGCFPFAQRTGDGRRAWRITAPGRGTVDAWVTSDGSLFIDGRTRLNVVYGILVHLLEVCPELALEDRITGMLHNRSSLLRLVRRDEEREQARRFDSDPEHTPPLAA